MASPTQQQQVAQKIPGENSMFPALVLLAGWLIPGAGHFLVGKYVRALFLFAAILTMYLTGLGLSGKIYTPNLGDLLDMLGFIGQLGSGLLCVLARVFGWGSTSVITALGDYGTKFLTVAGLLNIIAAVDAHSLAIGRKASL
jgi:hypothetical protein